MLGGVSIEFKHVGRSSALVLTMIDPALVSAATPPSAAPRMHELLACRVKPFYSSAQHFTELVSI